MFWPSSTTSSFCNTSISQWRPPSTIFLLAAFLAALLFLRTPLIGTSGAGSPAHIVREVVKHYESTSWAEATASSVHHGRVLNERASANSAASPGIMPIGAEVVAADSENLKDDNKHASLNASPVLLRGGHRRRRQPFNTSLSVPAAAFPAGNSPVAAIDPESALGEELPMAPAGDIMGSTGTAPIAAAAQVVNSAGTGGTGGTAMASAIKPRPGGPTTGAGSTVPTTSGNSNPPVTGGTSSSGISLGTTGRGTNIATSGTNNKPPVTGNKGHQGIINILSQCVYAGPNVGVLYVHAMLTSVWR